LKYLKNYIKLLIFFIPFNIFSCEILSNLNCSYEPDNCYTKSIFVPRQLSYNPILENALSLNRIKSCNDWCYFFSGKPLFTKSVGSKFNRYFNIGHKKTMDVKENGTGDIDSLWFKVISENDTFYSSKLSLCPVRKTWGSMFFGEIKLPCNFYLSVNTALIFTQNKINIVESNIQNKGTVSGFSTITDSFTSSQRKYGKICNSQTKAGIDDIQIKILKNLCHNNYFSWDIYVLLGIPTGSGSKAIDLFEPLVGSKHAQLGLGSYIYKNIKQYSCGSLNFLGEIKWRYGLPGKERRIFDLKDNGEWSRYLLFVKESAKSSTFFASNDLALESNITPRNSLDIYASIHVNRNKCNFEFGYDFWYRSLEKVSLNDKYSTLANNLGIADLVGIASLNPQSASTANISQSVEPGSNQMISNSSFITVKDSDLNLNSAASSKSISNSFYASVAYTCDWCCHPMQFGFTAAYEKGYNVNVPDNVLFWFNFDINF
jgi:hypothetical protein